MSSPRWWRRTAAPTRRRSSPGSNRSRGLRTASGHARSWRLALLLRHPAVALIDELAHTNVSAGARAKRYDDVIAVLRSGIDVITTLNVQHFEGVGDAVERLTGTRVRETLPDSVGELPDEVVFIAVTPDVLRQRLREGKIYPRARIDAALGNFFRSEN